MTFIACGDIVVSVMVEPMLYRHARELPDTLAFAAGVACQRRMVICQVVAEEVTPCAQQFLSDGVLISAFHEVALYEIVHRLERLAPEA